VVRLRMVRRDGRSSETIFPQTIPARSYFVCMKRNDVMIIICRIELIPDHGAEARPMRTAFYAIAIRFSLTKY